MTHFESISRNEKFTIIKCIFVNQSEIQNYEKYRKYTDFLFYNSEDGTIKVQVIADQETETIWTTQKGMSEIFGVEENTITYHLGNIYNEEELSREATTRKIRVVRQEGKSK